MAAILRQPSPSRYTRQSTGREADRTKSPIVVIGLGETGGVFARAFLHSGYPVYPLTRDMPMEQLARELDTPETVSLAVGESDLQHRCMGRSAPARLQRALQQADELKLELPRPRAIAAARL